MTIPGVLTAIFNTFWQTVALAVLVWLALNLVRMNAATRYVIWWAALAVSLMLPFVPRPVLSGNHSRGVAVSPQVSQSKPYDEPVFAEAPAIVTIPERPADRWPLALLAVGTFVLLWRLARIGQSYAFLVRVKRNAIVSEFRLPEIGRDASVLLSNDVASPMAAGFLHAAVILPTDLIERITPGELDQILLHEAAHLARRDDWWNLLARLLGAALALHPVAWWILRQIDYEREAACDDWVVARTGAVQPYAETLAHMAELRWQDTRLYRPEEALASGVFGRGSRIGDRIERLLEAGRQFSASVSRTSVFACGFVLCLLAATGTLAPRWVIFAQALRFEVASIRPATFSCPAFAAGYYDQSAGSGNKFCDSKVSISGTLVSIPRASVCQLIALAYGVPGYQIVGAPLLQAAPPGGGIAGLIEGGEALAAKNPKFFFDIEARAPGANAPTKDEVSAMLRDLLADRFRLKLHHDTKEMQYDAMVADKNGIKLTPAKEDCKPASGFQNLEPVIVRDAHICGKSMEDLARAISSNVDIPVVNKTGIDGRFDYDLHTQVERPADSHSAWLDAYRKQLGLVLETRKGPVDVLVVDHVETPSDN